MTEVRKEHCKVQMHDGKQCSRRLYQDQYCICHSRDENKPLVSFQRELNALLNNDKIKNIDLTKFVFPKNALFHLKKITKDIYFDQSVFFGDVDLSDLVFSSTVRFEKVTFRGSVNLNNTNFAGESIFFGADFRDTAMLTGTIFSDLAFFSNVTFREKTYFDYASFHKQARFTNAKFLKEAYIANTRFKEEVFFDYSVFSGKFSFHYTTFHKGASFRKANFEGDTSFFNVRFHEYISFNETVFHEEVAFKTAIFSGSAYFEKTIFGKNADFSDSQFEKEAHFRSCLFKKLVLFNRLFAARDSTLIFDANDVKNYDMFPSGAEFESLSLFDSKRIIFRKVHLDKCKFLETDISSSEFIDVIWGKISKFRGLRKRNAVFDEIALNEQNVHDIKSATLSNRYDLIAQIYRFLQANFINKYRYAGASDFYIGEQEMMRKAKGKFGQFLSMNFLYKFISYYGESFMLPLAWLLLLLLVFPSLFLYGGITLTGNLQDPVNVEIVNYDWSWDPVNLLFFKNDYWKAFGVNISFITFNRAETIERLAGIGDRLLVSVEMLLVIIFVTFFLLALRRRFKRKSF